MRSLGELEELITPYLTGTSKPDSRGDIYSRYEKDDRRSSLKSSTWSFAENQDKLHRMEIIRVIRELGISRRFIPPKDLIYPTQGIHYLDLPPKFSKNQFELTLEESTDLIEKFFNRPIRDKVYRPIGEMLRNARAHGGSKDVYSTTLGLFFNPNLICVGCYDGGDYFKDERTKRIWESKGIDQVKIFHEPEDEEARTINPGCHIGNNFIRNQMNRIWIDTDLGIIYGVPPRINPT